jgi:hypothetical protein
MAKLWYGRVGMAFWVLFCKTSANIMVKPDKQTGKKTANFVNLPLPY